MLKFLSELVARWATCIPAARAACAAASSEASASLAEADATAHGAASLCLPWAKMPESEQRELPARLLEA